MSRHQRCGTYRGNGANLTPDSGQQRIGEAIVAIVIVDDFSTCDAESVRTIGEIVSSIADCLRSTAISHFCREVCFACNRSIRSDALDCQPVQAIIQVKAVLA